MVRSTAMVSMLIDELMPRWDLRERHHIRVRAPAVRACDALRTADLGGIFSCAP